MTDRRDPMRKDRRQLHVPPGGRRATDPLPPHGTRTRYQRGCRCTPCRAAEAAYRAQLRMRHLRALPTLGALVSATEARRRIRQLKREEYPVARIERLGGWGPRTLQLTRQQRIRLSTLLRIRRLALWVMLEGVDDDAGDE